MNTEAENNNQISDIEHFTQVQQSENETKELNVQKGDAHIPALYMHAGSGNHGCEAIANSLVHLISEQTGTNPVIVTENAEEDRRYTLGNLENAGKCKLVEEQHIDRHFFTHVQYYLKRKITGDAVSFQRYRFAPILQEDNTVTDSSKLAISIGGDNYCYPEMVHDLALADKAFHEKGYETILLGCSLEPSDLGVMEHVKDGVDSAETSTPKANEELLEDLHTFRKIIARESITYNALKEAGFKEEQIALFPDSAFTLKTAEVDTNLPEGFIPGEMVGINLSPMVQAKEAIPGITMQSYRNLIQHILDTSSYNVALIPHVIWNSNNDLEPLTKLYDMFKDTGRVVLIGDHTAEELKGYISKCALFIGARTHSTIAAYSTMVPTLVLGYSVKSRGIATDLFGTDENYVMPVQNIRSSMALADAFDWLNANQKDIWEHLQIRIPEYMENYSKKLTDAIKL